MDKDLLKKRWAIPLLLIGLLFSSCIDKDYDMDNISDENVVKDMKLDFPLGTIKYSALDIAKKANFGEDIVAEGDTLFLRYYRELEFSGAPGASNSGTLPINVFRDVEEGSVLYFSNPIFNCKVENKGSTPLTFDINSIRGKKESYSDIPFDFNGSPSVSISVSENKTVTRRFDRINAKTNEVFRIGDPKTGVGPDFVVYDYSHTAQGNNDILADMTAMLPLSFDKDSRIIFRDTLSMDLASYKEDYEGYEDYINFIQITIEYTNKMPVGGVTEFIFLNEKDQPITELAARKSNLNKADLRSVQMQGFTSNVTQKERLGTMYIKFDKTDWKAAQNIKSMIIKGTMENPENIHVLPSDFLKFKIMLYIEGDVKLNF
ncbi:MAG: hypothetical protein LBU83_04615 [Bacteroidales bacterium]|jgi:hypothetical protein|nr:hypothetical protein [Bacteroidales bacterium]